MPGAASPLAPTGARLTRALIHLDRLTHNVRLLRELAGGRPLWPAVKANAYGHGAGIVARHLTGLGHERLCVADVSEAMALAEAGIGARFLVLSATLPEHATALVALGCEAALCTVELAEALASEARRAGKEMRVHLKVDTGMGRVGIRPDEVADFLDRCAALDGLQIKGIMSHFARADETDKTPSELQLARFREVLEATRGRGFEVRHMANSAAILDLPDSHFDAVRAGVSIYGLAPSPDIVNPRVRELRPVLEWRTRIVFLKEVPTGTGLSYGHAQETRRDSLIATLPVGYGDGLSRRLSGNFDVLVGGVRCPQVGRITMDQCLIDVTALRGRVVLGDDAVLIGRGGDEEITADELAGKLGTISYEIVTAIADRVTRVAIADGGHVVDQPTPRV